MEGQGRCVACRIIVSAQVPDPFLWTLDLGFGTWIWDLDLGPTWIWDLDLELGFMTGLGLNNNLPQYVSFAERLSISN